MVEADIFLLIFQQTNLFIFNESFSPSWFLPLDMNEEVGRNLWDQRGIRQKKKITNITNPVLSKKASPVNK